jgi:predicted metalloendopeptidase
LGGLSIAIKAYKCLNGKEAPVMDGYWNSESVFWGQVWLDKSREKQCNQIASIHIHNKFRINAVRNVPEFISI